MKVLALAPLYIAQLALGLSLPYAFNQDLHQSLERFNSEIISFENHQVWTVNVVDNEQIQVLSDLSDVKFYQRMHSHSKRRATLISGVIWPLESLIFVSI